MRSRSLLMSIAWSIRFKSGPNLLKLFTSDHILKLVDYIATLTATLTLRFFLQLLYIFLYLVIFLLQIYPFLNQKVRNISFESSNKIKHRDRIHWDPSMPMGYVTSHDSYDVTTFTIQLLAVSHSQQHKNEKSCCSVMPKNKTRKWLVV